MSGFEFYGLLDQRASASASFRVARVLILLTVAVLSFAPIVGCDLPGPGGGGPRPRSWSTSIRTPRRRSPPPTLPKLRDRIANSSSGPLYIAVVPAAARNEAGGDATDWLRLLAERLDRRGTYAVVVGNQFRAGRSFLERGEAARLASEAFEEHRDEGVAALLAFVDNVRPRVPAARTVTGRHLALAYPRGRRRRRHRVRPAAATKARPAGREALATGKAVAQEDLLALADDIRALDLDVEMPDADRDAKEHYGRAVDAYERADRAFDTARRPQDLAAVSSALEEGRYEMASAKARWRAASAPRAPAAVLLRPSPRTVRAGRPLGAAGGEPRQVPACAADAVRIEEGSDPEQREVHVGGRTVPYYGVPAWCPTRVALRALRRRALPRVRSARCSGGLGGRRRLRRLRAGTRAATSTAEATASQAATGAEATSVAAAAATSEAAATSRAADEFRFDAGST